jgi:membrane protein YdbS with pleckstrin-like domain
MDKDKTKTDWILIICGTLLVVLFTFMYFYVEPMFWMFVSAVIMAVPATIGIMLLLSPLIYWDWRKDKRREDMMNQGGGGI